LADGFSRRCVEPVNIYSWIKAKSFPAPVKLGPRSVAWLKEEVDAWVTARVATTRFDSGDD
jgi:predicted DNA-binding transcriptional regulator AlpA